ncbi:MAG: hypothetical protein R3C28_33380 [Pirellulaceae bacterium]
MLLIATGISTTAWLDAAAQRDVANAAVGELTEKQAELEAQKKESDIQAQNAKAAAANQKHA